MYMLVHIHLNIFKYLHDDISLFVFFFCQDLHAFQKYGPLLFPVKELLQLLIRVISTSTTKIQQLATAALVEVAKSVSGGKGCAKIGTDETKALLESLKSPCTASRESALLVRGV